MGDRPLAGVGIYFQQEIDGRVYVKTIPPDGPAGRNGEVKEDDLVLRVGDTDVTNLSLMDMRDLIVGEEGSQVSLDLRRYEGTQDEQDLRVVLTRGVASGSAPAPAAPEEPPAPAYAPPAVPEQPPAPQYQSSEPAELPTEWNATGARFVEALNHVEQLRVELNGKLEDAFQRLYEHKEYVERHLEQQHAHLERQRKLLEQERAQFVDESRGMQGQIRAAQPAPVMEGVVDLNVGGKTFTTKASTLAQVPGSLLESMFNGTHPITKDANGRYFIDRSPKYFETILEYLRTQSVSVPSQNEDRRALKSEAEFFGLPGLVKMLDAYEGRQLLSPNGTLGSQFISRSPVSSISVGSHIPTTVSYVSSPGRALQPSDYAS